MIFMRFRCEFIHVIHSSYDSRYDSTYDIFRSIGDDNDLVFDPEIMMMI